MTKVLNQLARRQLRVIKTEEFDFERPDAELQRLAKIGAVLLLTKGFYALVPEDRRGPGTTWRPTAEAAGLGIAAALYGSNNVALVGPSAARVHRCYPRGLGEVYVAVPKQRRARNTIVGNVRFVKRDITKLDIVRADTDLGIGWVTSFEQTALDLCRSRPAWAVTEEARAEMIRLLSERIDWDIIEEIAAETRSVNTLRRLRVELSGVE